jgi:hypothetical protein
LLAMVGISENTDFQIDEPLYIRRPDAIPTKERAV